MINQHAPLDTTLERTLGSAALTPEQRRRHLERIAARSRTGRFSPGRLLRDGTVAVVLVALMAGAWLLLPLGESSESEIDPMAAIAAFREDFTEPTEPGYARYDRIVYETSFPQMAGVTVPLEIDVWERVNENGFLEKAIISYDDEGNVASRAIEFEDRWVFESPGFWDEDPTGLGLIPPNPALTQSIAAVWMASNREQFDEFLSGAEAETDVEISEVNGQIRILSESPFDFDQDEALEDLGEQIGLSVKAVIVEITLDPDAQQLSRWAIDVEDEDGQRHTLQSFKFSHWEDIDPAEIPDDAFAERTDLSEQEIEIPMPERIETSFGTLEARDTEMRSPGFGTVTYLGPPPLFIEVRISLATSALDTDQARSHPIQLPGIDGYWIADHIREEWPRNAVWVDDGLEFNLNARNLPEGGWAEDDLYELIEALVD